MSLEGFSSLIFVLKDLVVSGLPTIDCDFSNVSKEALRMRV
jgi:hypothetical protein